MQQQNRQTKVAGQKSRRQLRRYLLASAAFTVVAAPAFAQDGGIASTVTITGTRIRGIAPTGAPVTRLDKEEIDKTGLLDVADILRSVPQVSTLGISGSTTGTTANGQGTNTTFATGVNIHGLGTQATLTLVDGIRGAPGGQFGNYFAPANVPSIALSGIEILTDGASAIYGSDAMAGVVNLTLRKHFDGAEVRAAYNFADNYDANDISAIVGRSWDEGYFMTAVQHSHASSLLASDRPELFIADAPSVFAGSGALPRGYTNYTVNPNIRAGGVYYAGPYGATSFADFTPDAQNIEGAWYNGTALPKQVRDSAIMSFEEELGGGLTAYGMGLYSERSWDAFGHVSGSNAAINSVLNVPSTNPYFIAGVPGVTTSETVNISQLNNLGPQTFHGVEKSWIGTLGIKYDIADTGWQLDINGQTSGNRVQRDRYNELSSCGLTGGSTCTVNPGEITNGSGDSVGALGQTDPNLAFNPFGPNTDTVYSRIHAFRDQYSYYNSHAASAKLDGPLFDLPGGMVRAAVGVDYREDTEGQENSDSTRTPAADIYSIVGTSKSMNIKSAFAEVVVPIIGDSNAMPLVQRLDISGAVRYSDYSILSKKSTNPKFGLTWVPVNDLSVSASYAKSFRVNLASTDANNAPLLRIRSIADYLPAGGTAFAIQRGGGNPDLSPEESKTITAGIDWQPSEFDGFRLSASYFNVKYSGVIDTPGAAVLNSVTANAEAIYGDYITRRPSTVSAGADDTAYNALVASLIAMPQFSGPVLPVDLIVDARSNNAGVIKANGLDFSVSKTFEVGSGQLYTGLNGELFFAYKRSLTPSGALVSRKGQIDFPTDYRLRGQIGWNDDNFGAVVFLNYTPGYTNTYPTPTQKVSDYLTADLTLSYTVGADRKDVLHDLRLSVSVQNLFNTKPPYVEVFEQYFDSSMTNMLRRVVSVQLSKGF
jgi:iron complex outermembrane recepter protein